MKLGFLTACLPDEDLAGIAAWAAGQGYQALEVAADGVLSVEHEDPVWGGTPDRVRTGLQVAFRTLSPLIIA